MGNIASCAPSITSTSAVRVLFVMDNRLRLFTKPLKAADIIINNPGSFLCDSSDLKVGHRIPGLSSDECLIPRRTYFLLPMELLYSVLTVDEMRFLSDQATKLGSMNLSKIFVDFNCWFPEIRCDQRLMGYEYGEEKDVELVDGCSRQRSWRPSLETILEIPTPMDD